MRVALTVTVFVAAACAGRGASGGGGAGGAYVFYRQAAGTAGAPDAGGTRRVFGGAPAELETFPWVVAILDRYGATRCSGSAVAPRWVLTAAHCVSPRLAYVKYNTRRPASPDGDFTPVHTLYRHPKFEVIQTTGEDADVLLLHHDVGLVRTREAMRLRRAPPADLRAALRSYDPAALPGREVQVLGFGRTERSVLGDELFGARLRLLACPRAAWLHCVCASAGGAGGGEGGGAARGVCSGDSGGPVIYRNVQVGVTSMGPAECARAGAALPESATSVFTALFPYADVLTATIADTDAELHMRRVSAAAPPPLAPATAAARRQFVLLLAPLTLIPAR